MDFRLWSIFLMRGRVLFPLVVDGFVVGARHLSMAAFLFESWVILETFSGFVRSLGRNWGDLITRSIILTDFTSLFLLEIALIGCRLHRGPRNLLLLLRGLRNFLLRRPALLGSGYLGVLVFIQLLFAILFGSFLHFPLLLKALLLFAIEGLLSVVADVLRNLILYERINVRNPLFEKMCLNCWCFYLQMRILPIVDKIHHY